MKIVRLAAAVSLAIAVTGCGPNQGTTGTSSSASEFSHSNGSSRQEAPATAGATAFGVSRLWQNGLAITISEPKSLAPSDTAYPKAPRAAVFEVTVTNGGSNPYKPSELSVRAIVAGQHAQEVLDSAQGLNGIASANEEVLPGKQLTTTLAFAMPEQRAPVKVTVQPSTSSLQTPEAVYEGQA